MYNLLCLITGVAISVMIAINGRLTLVHGMFAAAVVIHIVGVIFAALAIKLKGGKIPRKKEYPLWMYMGGVIGVLTTFFNNFSYGKISVTSIMALGLFGQTITSIIFDSFGIMGMEKHPFKKSNIIGLLFSLAGIIIMLDDSVGAAVVAMVLSACAGLTVVTARTINARLAQNIGDVESSYINHLAGLPVVVLLAVFLGWEEITGFGAALSPSVWIYLGGTLGVTTVVLCNVTVPKVPAFRLTLLTFVGQIFSGIAIDMVMKTDVSPRSFQGGLLVAAGIGINIILEQLLESRKGKGNE